VPGTGDPTFGELTPQVPFPRLNDTTYRFSSDFAGRVPRGGLSIGFVTDEVTAFLRALEEVTNTTVLSNPKVVVINKHVGRLLVGARNGYRTLTTTQTSTTENIEFLETGTELRFRPFISADGHVRLEVTPRDSRGSVDALGLPNENTTEVTTNILMKDGHTVVIAGLFREASSAGRSQIPLLGSIPWAGTAFGAKSDSTVKQEIIILLTVHIIDDPENYSREADHLLEDAERLRVGLRRGMQWTGRSRLAQAHYEAALRALSAGKLGLAEWHTDLAIHNRPQLVEALRLREDIRQQRDWEEDGSLVRDYIRRLMQREEGLPDTRYGRPVPHVPRPGGGDPASSPGAAGASGSPMSPPPGSDAGASSTGEEPHGGMQP
jgi:type IV pilus assembly protein PilQ